MSFHIVPIAEADVLTLIKSIDKVIINPIIIFLFAVAIVYFLYGVAQYLLSPENEEVRKKSKSHMIWGIVGLFIMVAVFGIMRLLLSTFGETKIQVNTSGEFNVSDTTIENKPPVGSGESGEGLFNGGVDVTNPVLKDSPVLPPETFTNSPFAVYEAKPALCWNNNNKPFHGKASTEYNALNEVNFSARSSYLAYLKQTNPSVSDKTNPNYPIKFASEVLYDKTTKTYHAWLDARAPLTVGKTSDCNLRILKEAPAIPESIVFSKSDISSDVNSPELLAAVYITNPFPIYEAKPLLCWNNDNEPFYDKATTEFSALNLVKASAKSQYLKDTGVVLADANKSGYPVTFQSKVLYDKNAKVYHAWLDARAPVGSGKMSDCASLKVVAPAPVIPSSVATSGELNLSESVLNNNILDFTKSPFTQKYVANPLCWRDEVSDNSDTEFKATNLVKAKARSMYLDENNLSPTTKNASFPIIYGSLTFYDKVTKKYYVWLDARGPVGTGKISDCDLIKIGEPEMLPSPTYQSGKTNPLSRYTSNGDFYRVVDSGSDFDYFTARNIAINNALIQIAHLKGLTNVSGITSKRILEEKYYPQDPFTLLYDYWVAIESPI